MKDVELGTSGDLVIEGGHLKIDSDLRGRVMSSLLADDVREGTDGWVGWWAAEFMPQGWGSGLHALRRQPLTSATVELARQYAQAALQWLVREGLARSVTVEGSRLGNVLILKVKLERAVWETLTIPMEWSGQ